MLIKELLAISEAAKSGSGVRSPSIGWCLVMANKKVTGSISADKQDAISQQKKAPVATELKWGKRAPDGSYVSVSK